jgi:hypothetical protein
MRRITLILAALGLLAFTATSAVAQTPAPTPVAAIGVAPADQAVITPVRGYVYRPAWGWYGYPVRPYYRPYVYSYDYVTPGYYNPGYVYPSYDYVYPDRYGFRYWGPRRSFSVTY